MRPSTELLRSVTPAARMRDAVRRLGFDLVRFPNPTHALGPHLLAVLKSIGVDCVLDVGAHWGEYGSELRAAGYRGDIVSFEPVAESFSRLEERVAGDSRWTARRLALGSEDGAADIHVSQASDLSSLRETNSYARSLFPEAAEIVGSEAVEVRRLDGILDDCVGGPERPIFLKVDTQGWDLEVLAGAERCLDRIRGLQVEASVKPIYEGMPSYLEALSALDQLGFELTGLFPVQRDDALRIVELDCVLTRAPRELGRVSLARS